MTAKEKPTGLALLREPFPPHQISKLPKPTKQQTEAVRADFKAGIRCQLCGQWHHPQVVHLDYVGHAALTDRLLDCDPEWTWEPLALDANGLPAMDVNGGLWIRLTICGVTRLGYGDAEGKRGGNAIKEAIGDALRNAAMRFGAALDLWHKGDLHGDQGEEDGADDEPPLAFNAAAAAERVKDRIRKANDLAALRAVFAEEEHRVAEIGAADPALRAQIKALAERRRGELTTGDDIPYEGPAK